MGIKSYIKKEEFQVGVCIGVVMFASTFFLQAAFTDTRFAFISNANADEGHTILFEEIEKMENLIRDDIPPVGFITASLDDVQNICNSKNALGCYSGVSTRIYLAEEYITRESIRHELMHHAIYSACEHSFLNKGYEESLADLYSGSDYTYLDCYDANYCQIDADANVDMLVICTLDTCDWEKCYDKYGT